MVYQAIEKVKVIQDRLKAAQSHQKSYTNVRHRDLKFEFEDKVFLKGRMLLGGETESNMTHGYKPCVGVRMLVILDMAHIKNQGGVPLLFPLLIKKLCKRDKVEVYLGDTCVSPRHHIYPFKIWGEGASGKSKKRKINLCRSKRGDVDSCRPSTAGSLERGYLSLSHSHRELRVLHEKMKKKEKKREFFHKDVEGGEGPLEVLEPKDRLSSPRVDSDYEAPTEWSGLDDARGDAETEGNNSY
ncbi:putative 14 kDa proline-rich protein DC2.15-like [Capsicum annuum]|nr:putative 14 kDa proline-rich protein DC2.15-like [Capsicum annuum]KAF3639448.1 putative 14 kDa proline-rich protein DC2.15-like [Capsicum annuum]